MNYTSSCKKKQEKHSNKLSDLKTMHKIVKMTHKHNLNVIVSFSTHQLAADSRAGRVRKSCSAQSD